jgi:hypothetical protein
MSSIPSKGDGTLFVVPKYVESKEAQVLADTSDELDRAEQEQLLLGFDVKHVSPQSLPTVLGPIGKSAIRAHPYKVPNSKSGRKIEFTDEEVNKNILKCDAGHQPIYQKDVSPFEEYDHRPSSVCKHNTLNRYLTWNDRKQKYCCASEPDSNEHIMERSKDNIMRMLESVTINSESLHYINHAINKYIEYYKLVHPAENSEIEKARMIELRDAFVVQLTSGREPKSLRVERARRLTVAEANKAWDITRLGGTKRKSRIAKRTNKTNRTNRTKRTKRTNRTKRSRSVRK